MAYESLPKKGAATSSDNTSLITQNVLKDTTAEDSNSFDTVTLNGNVTTVKDSPFKEFCKYKFTIKPEEDGYIDYDATGIATADGIVVIGSYNHHGAGLNDIGKIVVYSDKGEFLWEKENPNPSANAYFGQSVAIGGGRIIVGTPRDELKDVLPSNVNDYGRVYVFDYDGNEVGQILPDSGIYITSGLEFGQNVAVDTETGIIAFSSFEGVDALTDYAGAVYLHNLNDLTFIDKLTYPTADAVYSTVNSKKFGYKIAAADGKLAVTTQYTTNNGTTYPELFVYDLATRTLDFTAQPFTGDSDQTSVIAINSGYVFVSYHTTDLSKTGQGIIYCYTLSGNYIKSLTFPSSYGRPLTTVFHFGYSMAANNGILAVSAPGGDPMGSNSTSENTGALILFNVATLEPYDYQIKPRSYVKSNDMFGLAISDSGDLFAIADKLGDFEHFATIDVFDLSGGVQKLSKPDLTPYINLREVAGVTDPDADFGINTGIGDGVIVCGAPKFDTDGNTQAGIAYVFNYKGDLLYTLKGPSVTAGYHYGQSVAVGEGIIAVAEMGAPSKEFIDTAGVSGASTDVGRLHLYDVVDGSFIQTLDIPSSENPVDNQRLGNSTVGEENTPLTIKDGLILCGASGSGSSPIGRAYVWDTAGNFQFALDPQGTGTTYEIGYGASVAIGRGMIAVSSSDGSNTIGYVNLYEMDGTPITNFNAFSGSRFGHTIKFSEKSDYIYVSAVLSSSIGYQAGKVEVFDLDGNYIKDMFPSLNDPISDKFGSGMDVSGGFIFIGAPYGQPGYFNVFDDTTQQLIGIRLTSNSSDYPFVEYDQGINTDLFGHHISAKDGVLVVSTNDNGVFLYDITDGILHSLESTFMDGDSFIEVNNSNLKPTLVKQIDYPLSNFEANFSYGYAIASEGNTVFVSVYDKDINGVTSTGIVYALDASDLETVQFTLESPNPATNGEFGRGIAVDENYIAVAETTDGIGGQNDYGSVYIFDRSGNYLRQVYAVDTDGVTTFAQGNLVYGYQTSIALKDGLLVVGAVGYDGTNGGEGSVWIYDVSTGDLVKFLGTSNADTTFTSGAAFGASIGVGEGIIAISARGADVTGSNNGGIFLYDYAGNYLTSLIPDNSTNSNVGDCSIIIRDGAVYFTSKAVNEIHKFTFDGNEVWTTEISLIEGSTNNSQRYDIEINADGTEIYAIASIDDSLHAFSASNGLELFDSFYVDSLLKTGANISNLGSTTLLGDFLYVASVGSGDNIGKLYKFSVPTTNSLPNPVGLGTNSFSTEIFYKTSDEYISQSKPIHLLGDADTDTGGWSTRLETTFQENIPPSLVATLTETGVSFGKTGAIGENSILVGDEDAANNGNPSNSGEVYGYDFSGNLLFSIVAPASDSAANLYFGNSIVADDGVIAIAAKGFNSNIGKVYVYSDNGNNAPTILYTLTTSSAEFTEFGSSIALKDGLLVVGTTEATSSSASVFVYDAPTGNLLHELSHPTSATNTDFGIAVDVGYGRISVSSIINTGDTRVFLYDYQGNLSQSIDPYKFATFSNDSTLGVVSKLGENCVILGSTKGGILKFDFEGNLVWRRRYAEDSSYTTNTGFGQYLDIDENLILLTTPDTTAQTDEVQLWGLDGDILQKFSGDLGSNVGFGSNAVVIRNGKILIGSGSNTAYIFKLQYTVDKVAFKYRNLISESGSSLFERKSDDYTKTQSALLLPYDDDFNLGSGDFTIEAWVNLKNPVSENISGSTYEQTIISLWGETISDQAFKLEVDESGRPQVKFNLVGSSVTLTSPDALIVNTWHHLAAIRSSDVFKLYIDGVEKATITGNNTIVTGAVEFDGNDYLQIADNEDFELQSSNNNISKINFTIEAWIYLNTLNTFQSIVSKYNSSGASTDGFSFKVNDVNELIFISSDGSSISSSTSVSTLSSNTWYHVAVTREDDTLRFFIDGRLDNTTSITGLIANSPDPVTIGAVDGSSEFFNGKISNLRIVKGSALYTSNFTPPTEKLTTVNGNGKNLVFNGTFDIYGKNYWFNGSLLVVSGSQLKSTRLNNKGAATYIYTVPGQAYRFSFVAGDLVSGGAMSIRDNSDTGTILTSVTIVANTTRKQYSSTFVALSTRSVIEAGHSSDSGNFIFDDVVVEELPTTSLLCCQSADDPRIEASQPGITGSVAFDGSFDFLSIPSSSDLQPGSSDFTIEGWIYINTTGQSHAIASKWSFSGASAQEFQVIVDSNNRLRASISNGTNSLIYESNQDLSADTWYHFAVVKNGNNIKIYIDGSETLNNSSFTGTIPSTSNDLFVGSTTGSLSFFNGYISNLRFIKGTALYTTTFTPPTEELTAVTGTSLLCCQSPTDATEEATGKTITVNGDAVPSYASPGLLNGEQGNVSLITANGDPVAISLNGVSGVFPYNPNFIVPTTVDLSIGASNSGSLPADGYISNARITKGISLYNGTFSPRRRKFSAEYESNFGSTLFDSNDKLILKATTDLHLDTDDWSITFWIRPTTFANDSTIVGIWDDLGNKKSWYVELTTFGTIRVHLSTDGIFATSVINGPTINANEWTHIEVKRDINNIVLYVNGSYDSHVPAVVPYNFGTSEFLIIGDKFGGYISNLHIINGKGQPIISPSDYSEAQVFPVPTAEFGENTTDDILFNDVFLLLHLNTGSLTDSSSNALTGFQLQGNGSSITADAAKFGAGGLRCFNTSLNSPGHLSFPTDNALFLGGDDFTIELFTKGNLTGTFIGASKIAIRYIFNTTSLKLYARITINDVVFDYTFAGVTTPTETWYHWVIERTGDIILVYVDGVVIPYTWDVSGVNFTLSDAYLGTTFGNIGTNVNFRGDIDEFRVTKGVARYSSLYRGSPTTPSNPTSYTLPADIVATNFGGDSGEYIAVDQDFDFNFGMSDIRRFAADSDAEHSDWTMDFWFFPNEELSTNVNIIEPADSKGFTFTLNTDGTYTVKQANGPTGSSSSNTFGEFKVGEWNHFLAQKQGSNYVYITLNGIFTRLVSTQSFTDLRSTADLLIGKSFNGKISNWKFFRDDAYGSYRSLAARFHNIKYRLTSTNPGSSGFEDAIAKYLKIDDENPYSLIRGTVFDGSSYIVAPASSDFDFGSGDFTIEFNILHDSSSTNTNRGIVSLWKASQNRRSWRLEMTNNTTILAEISTDGGGGTTLTGTVSEDSWNHVILVRVGNTLELYVNGVSQATAAFTLPVYSNSVDEVVIGKTESTSSDGYIGNISNLRILKGTGLYGLGMDLSENKVDPFNSALPGTRYIGETFISNNKGGNGAVFPDDFAPATTVVSNASATTGSMKFGGGATDYVRIFADDRQGDLNATEDLGFSIECWIRYDSTVTNSTIVRNGSQYELGVVSGNVVFEVFGGVYTATSTTTLVTGQWYHIAAIRTDAGASSLLNLYIDGTREASVAGPPSSNASGSSNYRFGENHDGWISNFRFVVGAEVYSGTSFTVPTKELSIFDYPSVQTAPRTGIIAFTQSSIESSPYAAKYLCDTFTTQIAGTVNADTTNPGLTRDIFTTSLSACRTDNILYEATGKILSVSGNPQVGPGAPDWSCKVALFNTDKGVTIDRVGAETVTLSGTPSTYTATEDVTSTFNTVLYACSSKTDVTDNSPVDDVYVDPNPYKLIPSSDPTATSVTPDLKINGNSANSLIALQSSTDSTAESTEKTVDVFSNLSLTQDLTGKSLTPDGNVSLVTSPDGIGFDTVAFNFDSSSYIQVADSSDLQLSSSNFTIEFWVKLRDLSTEQYIISKWDPADSSAASEFDIKIQTDGSVFARVNTTYPLDMKTNPALINKNTWHHIALSRNVTTLKLFVDGAQQDISTFSTTINSTTNPLTIGTQRANLTTSRLNGQISNLRIVKGSTVYNNSFTVPTSPLTNITNTSFLLTSSPVDSVNAFTINPTQNPTGAVYFNGTDDFLSIADGNVVGYGTDNFTIECWVNTTNNTLSGAQQRTIFGSDVSDAQGQLFIEQGTGNVGFGNTTGGFFNIKSTTSVTDGSWHHIAAVKRNDVATLYIDGTSEASAANTVNYVAPALTFASNPGFGTTAGDIVTTGWDAETGSTLTYSGGDFATLSRDTTSIDGQWVHTKFLNTIPGELYVVETDVSSTTDDFIIGIGSTNDTTNFTHSSDIFITDTTTATGSRIERSFKFKATTTDTAIALGIVGSTAQSASIYKLDVYTNNDNIFIGSSNASGGFFEGAISNFYISHKAEYTKNFTPPTEEVDFSYKTKLICCKNESNTLSENSGKIEEIIRIKKDSLKSIIFDEEFVLNFGAGSYYNNQLNSDPFTIEFFVKFTETSLFNGVPRGIWNQDKDDQSTLSANFGVIISDGTLVPYPAGTIALRSGSYFMASDSAINDGRWHHVAITRGDGGADTHRIYIDGVENATATDNSVDYNSGSSAQPVLGGGYRDGTLIRGGAFKGKLSNFRVIRGEAIYTTGSSFTPPANPLPLTDKTTSLVTADDGEVRNAQLLATNLLNGLVEYYTVIGETGNNVITVNPISGSQITKNIQLSEDNPLYNSRLNSYAGFSSNNYQTINSFDAKDWYNYKDFTIEFYINPNSFGHGDILNSNVISHSNPSGTQTRNLIDYSSGLPAPSGSAGDQIYVLPGGQSSVSGYPIYVFDNNAATIFSPSVGAGVTLGNPLRVYQGQRLAVKCEYNNLSTFQINQTINTTRGADTNGFVDITDSLTFTNGVFDITEIGRELNGSSTNMDIRDIEIDGELVIDSAYGSYKVVDESSFSQNPTVDEHWSFGPNFAGLPTFYYWNGSENRIRSSQEIKKNVWSHLALVKNGDTIKMYVNGTETASAAYAGGATSNINYPVMIGRSLTNSFDGQISGFKMSSSAVYTSNFTPTFEVSTSTNSDSIIHSSNTTIIGPVDSSSKLIASNAESYIGPTELASPETVTSSDLEVKEITKEIQPYSTPTGRYIPNAKVIGSPQQGVFETVDQPENIFTAGITTSWQTRVTPADGSGFSEYSQAIGVEFTPLEVYYRLEVYFYSTESLIVNDVDTSLNQTSTSGAWVDVTDQLVFPPQTVDPIVFNTFDTASSIDDWVAYNSNVTWDSVNGRLSVERVYGTEFTAYLIIPTETGKQYTFSADYTKAYSRTLQAPDGLHIYDGSGPTGGTLIKEFTIFPSSPESQGTVTFKDTFTALSTTTRIQVIISAFTVFDPQTNYIDNLVVRELPTNPFLLSKLSFPDGTFNAVAEIWALRVDSVIVDENYIQQEGASTVTVSNILTNEDTVGFTTFNNPDQSDNSRLGMQVVTNNKPNGVYIVSGDGDVAGSSGIGTIVAFDGSGTPIDAVSSIDTLSNFGEFIDANPDADKIIVGARNGDTGLAGAGNAYYYEFSGTTFNQIGSIIIPSNQEPGGEFGADVAINDDGSRFAVGARARDVGTLTDAGTVFAFERDNTTFTEVGILTATNLSGSDRLGWSIEMNDDGERIIASAPFNTSNTGVTDGGAVYIYDFNSGSGLYDQVGILTASTATTHSSTLYGVDLKCTYDAKTLAVTCENPGSSLTGSVNSGAVFVYDYDGTNYNEVGIVRNTAQETASGKFGYAIDLSKNGDKIAIVQRLTDALNAPYFSTTSAVFIYDRIGNDFYLSNSIFGNDPTIFDVDGNLVPEGTFDDAASINNWVADNSTVAWDSGNQRLSITRGTTDALTAYLNILTVPGRTYTLKCDFTGPSSGNSNRISVCDGAGVANTLGTQIAFATVAANTTAAVEFTFTALSTTSNIRTTIDVLLQTIYIDNLSVDSNTFAALDSNYISSVAFADDDEAVLIGVSGALNDAETVSDNGKAFKHDIKETAFNRSNISQNYDGVITISEVYKRLSSETIYLAGTTTDGHILRTIDGGENWTETNLSLRVSEINSFADTYNNGVIFASAVSKNAGVDLLWKSTDYGISWSPETTPTATSEVGTFVSFNDAIHIKDGIMLVVGRISSTQNVIFRSTDYGATWTDIDVATSVGFGSFDFIKNLTYCDNSEVIVANFAAAGVGEQGILRSTDYGLTWSHVVTGISFTDVEGQTLSIESTDFEISFAYDFTTNVLIGAAKRTATPNSTIKAYQGGTVIKSTDLGATWTTSTSDSEYSLIGRGFTGIVDGGGGGVFFAGDEKGRVFVSSNKGDNWTRYNIKNCYSISSITYINGRLLLGSKKIQDAQLTDIFYFDDSRDYFSLDNNGWNHLIIGREDSIFAFVYNNEFLYQSDPEDTTVDNIYYAADGSVYIGGTPEIESNFEGLVTHVRVQNGESLYQLDTSATSSNVFVKVNGNWRRAREVYIRVNGVWRRAEDDLIQVKDSNTTPTWSSWYSPTT